MTLQPRDLFKNWWTDIDRYHRELDEIMPIPSFAKYMPPWRNVIQEIEREVGGTTQVLEGNPDKFQVIVDVQQFAPEEILVKTDDKFITIEGKHEEKKDQHGYISRQFVRRYQLPQGYDIGHVKPNLSSDGVLTITAPRLVLPAPGERIIPITRTSAKAIKA